MKEDLEKHRQRQKKFDAKTIGKNVSVVNKNYVLAERLALERDRHLIHGFELAVLYNSYVRSNSEYIEESQDFDDLYACTSNTFEYINERYGSEEFDPADEPHLAINDMLKVIDGLSMVMVQEAELNTETPSEVLDIATGAEVIFDKAWDIPSSAALDGVCDDVLAIINQKDEEGQLHLPPSNVEGYKKWYESNKGSKTPTNETSLVAEPLIASPTLPEQGIRQVPELPESVGMERATLERSLSQLQDDYFELDGVLDLESNGPSTSESVDELPNQYLDEDDGGGKLEAKKLPEDKPNEVIIVTSPPVALPRDHQEVLSEHLEAEKASMSNPSITPQQRDQIVETAEARKPLEDPAPEMNELDSEVNEPTSPVFNKTRRSQRSAKKRGPSDESVVNTKKRRKQTNSSSSDDESVDSETKKMERMIKKAMKIKEVEQVETPKKSNSTSQTTTPPTKRNISKKYKHPKTMKKT